jgi:hypothetical protein
MIKIDILEIQKNIEDKRQVYGKKLEEFLLSKSTAFLKKFDEFLGSKFFCLWSIFIILLLSIFLRSRLDIGYNSAYYIDIADKISTGGKYYYNFFTNSSPLIFFIHLIPNFIAKLTGFSPIIVADYFVNILAITSLFFSARILEKSYLTQVHQNLIIASFAVGFFLRIGALEHAEFLTEDSFFLILSFPYICYSFARNAALSKKEMLCCGILAGLMPCLKLHYIILPIVMESSKFWQVKSSKFFLELDKLVMTLIALGYLVFVIKFMPEFLEHISFFQTGNFIYQIYPKIILLAVFLSFLRMKFSAEDRILFLLALANTVILILETLQNVENETCFLALTTPLLLKIFYDFVKSKSVDFSDKKFLLASLLLLSFIDRNFDLTRSIIFLWIFIIPTISIFFFRKLHRDFPKSIKQIFPAIVAFILLAILGITYLKNLEIFTLLSLVIFFLFPILYEKYHQKFYQKSSSFLIFIQFFLVANLLSFYINSFVVTYQREKPYQSPNYLTDSIIEYSNSYLQNNNQVVVFSYSLLEEEPVIHFVNGQNEKYIRTSFLFDSINQKTSDSLMLNQILQNLKNKISDKNTQILFINNSQYALHRKDRCIIGFLEYYFKDAEFREIFLENYQYSGRIFLAKEITGSSEIEFFSKEKDEFDRLNLSKTEPIFDFEIYTRKDAN